MKLGTLLAHRGLTEGPDPVRQNRLDTFARALEQGFGIEVDVRHCPVRRAHYIGHDPGRWTPEQDLERHLALWRRFPSQVVALNLKDLEDLPGLVRALAGQGGLDQVFLFDMELLEPNPGRAAEEIRILEPGVRLAARTSDRAEPLARAARCPVTDRVWLDEFDGPWAGPQDFAALKAAGKAIYAVSPDLHGAPLEVARSRWADFAAWGASGICTDHASDLALFLGLRPAERSPVRPCP